jgi:hypothetical protein
MKQLETFPKSVSINLFCTPFICSTGKCGKANANGRKSRKFLVLQGFRASEFYLLLRSSGSVPSVNPKTSRTGILRTGGPKNEIKRGHLFWKCAPNRRYKNNNEYINRPDELTNVDVICVCHNFYVTSAQAIELLYKASQTATLTVKEEIEQSIIQTHFLIIISGTE